MADETVFLDEGSVKVTNARIVIGGQTYAVANVTSVAAVRVPNILFRLGCGCSVALFSVLLLVSGIVAGTEVAGGEVEFTLFQLVGNSILFIFVAIMIMRGWWTMVMVTSADELSLLRSWNRSRILRVVDAVNQAIAHRG